MKRLVVVGPSCGGKSTAVECLKDERGLNVHAPLRYTDRPMRANETPGENKHLNSGSFNIHVKQRRIWPVWTKALTAPNRHQQAHPAAQTGEIRQRYGFDRLSPIEATRSNPASLIVYSANNGILRAPREQELDTFLAGSFVVIVWATEEVRRQRMEKRSPDLSNSERTARLADHGDDLQLAAEQRCLGYKTIVTDELTVGELGTQILEVARFVLAEPSKLQL